MAEEQACTVLHVSTPACLNGTKECLVNDAMECKDNEWVKVEECVECKDGSCVTQQIQNSLIGLFLNPANFYIGFLVFLLAIGGLMYIKLR
jgi:hypothetical protein